MKKAVLLMFCTLFCSQTSNLLCMQKTDITTKKENTPNTFRRLLQEEPEYEGDFEIQAPDEFIIESRSIPATEGDLGIRKTKQKKLTALQRCATSSTCIILTWAITFCSIMYIYYQIQ